MFNLESINSPDQILSYNIYCNVFNIHNFVSFQIGKTSPWILEQISEKQPEYEIQTP